MEHHRVFRLKKKKIVEMFETSTELSVSNHKSCFKSMKNNNNNKQKKNTEMCKYVPKFITNGIKKELINNDKYSPYEKFSNEVAFTILAVVKQDGSLAKEYDKRW